MRNDSTDLNHQLVTSYEVCFSQPNPDHFTVMCAHPLFAGSRFEELKIMREAEGDGHELMK